VTPRVVVFLAAVLIALLVGAYVTVELVSYSTRQTAPSEVDTTQLGPRGNGMDGATVMFRNTAAGEGYGHVATVALDDPDGIRTVLPVSCDRVDATGTARLCLTVDRGVLTTFTAALYDADWQRLAVWPLPGVPSRTRFSPDEKYVAFSAFITGESYATVDFSISTRIVPVHGGSAVDLEEFAFTVNGDEVTSADRNFWGVTFTADSNVFYATAASGGRTWLVRGDIAGRTVAAIRNNVECPALSPDGSRVAFKSREPGADGWTVAVLDLASGKVTVLPEERSVDDQVEWLDDGTVLYGLPDPGRPGDSGIWAVASDGSSPPELLIEHAWSPAVVRP
jgi:hypothetical protein